MVTIIFINLTPYRYPTCTIVTKLILYRIDTSSNEKCVYTYSKVDLGRIGGFILCVICSTYKIDVIGHKHNEKYVSRTNKLFSFSCLTSLPYVGSQFG